MTPYPKDCPQCGVTLRRPSEHDLHMERSHSDRAADRAVAEAIVDEIDSSGSSDDNE